MCRWWTDSIKHNIIYGSFVPFPPTERSTKKSNGNLKCVTSDVWKHVNETDFTSFFWQVELRSCLSACQNTSPYTCRVQNQRDQKFIRQRHHWSTSAINIRVKLWIRFQNTLRLSGRCLYTVYDQRLYCVFHQMKTCTTTSW